MRVETKRLYRDAILDELRDLIDNKKFCLDMYEKYDKEVYIDCLGIIEEKIVKRKIELQRLIDGTF